MAPPIHEGSALRIQINPLPEESQRGCVALARAALPPERSTWILIALYAGVVAAVLLLTPPPHTVAILVGVAAVLATALALQAYGARRLRHLSASDPHALETYFVELNQEGVRTWCDHVDARYPWTDFSKVTENKEFYLFVRPSATGAIIPKRVLDPALEAALRACIRDWAPDGGAELARDPDSSGPSN